uniref:Uncharacterized protein n=1 Tax=Pyxicephalus adspersus TaxID=30357 RepID=A0AAV3AD45_PYXAD|nr:TPA: hypothetical protein GDO54_017691 [Pyxicephalus adspersus]
MYDFISEPKQMLHRARSLLQKRTRDVLSAMIGANTRSLQVFGHKAELHIRSVSFGCQGNSAIPAYLACSRVYLSMAKKLKQILLF